MATDPKGEPFSIRLSRSTELLVADEARRTRRSKGAIVEAFTEEAARVRRFPGIGSRGDDFRRGAWMIGTGLDVWEVIEMLEGFGDAERLERESQPTAAQIRLAVAYREAYPDEIEAALAENDRPLDELLTLHPFIETLG
jgi:hypothetical protein